MKRIETTIKVLLSAFLIPLAIMASWYALSQTNPPVIEASFVNVAMKLTPIWDNLATAYRNQHRLVLAGFSMTIILVTCSLFINPKKNRSIRIFTTGASILVAVAANSFDCCWLFRVRPEWIGPQIVIRSIPWVIIGFFSIWIMTRNENNRACQKPMINA
ncbi:hypothetical protein P0Y35_15830 [Kiritimatiellaeota bacterium B1221]|nr:hypothetical protein [Kiritimatiellaeota bacterium B1221]